MKRDRQRQNRWKLGGGSPPNGACVNRPCAAGHQKLQAGLAVKAPRLAERWQSGRSRRTRNAKYGQLYRGFESLPLRQFIFSYKNQLVMSGIEGLEPLRKCLNQSIYFRARPNSTEHPMRARAKLRMLCVGENVGERCAISQCCPLALEGRGSLSKITRTSAHATSEVSGQSAQAEFSATSANFTFGP